MSNSLPKRKPFIDGIVQKGCISLVNLREILLRDCKMYGKQGLNFDPCVTVSVQQKSIFRAASVEQEC